MSIKFPCPHCGQRISAEPAQAGQGGECPTCSQPIIVPEIQAAPVRLPPPPPRMAMPAVAQSAQPPTAKPAGDGCAKGCGGCLGLIGVVFILGIIGSIISPSTPSSSSSSSSTRSSTPTVYQRALKEAPYATYQQGYDSARRSGLSSDIEPVIGVFRTMKCSDAFISGYRAGCAENARHK